MASPHAYGSSGSAAASATPAASPTEVSTALDTTAGRPHASATRSAGADPAQRLDLDHDDVGRARRPDPQRVLGLADRLIGRDRNVDKSTQRRELLQRGAGLFRVLERVPAELAEHARRDGDVPAAVGVHPDPPAGPAASASRTAATRSTSSASACPGSATLTFAVRQPDAATISYARSGPTAGTVTLTGTRSRTGAGHGTVADSIALASHRADSRGPYSANGENSPHPAGPWISAPAGP